MKKQSFTFLVAALFLVQGMAQQVEQQQRSLITKRTASWCTFCGTWGWSFFENAIEQNEEKAILLAAHYSGDLVVDAAADITSNFGGVSQPRFFFNQTDHGVSSGNSAAKLTALKALVDAAYEQAPVANSGFDPVYVNGEIKVNAKVKFFQAAEGEYFLGMYLLEDNVVSFQQSVGNNAVHKNIMRFSFTDDSFGLPIVNGSVTANQEFDLDFALPIGDPAGKDYEVLGIIWKKENGKYIPVNVWSNDNIALVSNTSVENPKYEMIVYPTVTSEVAGIDVQLIEDQPLASIDVFDAKGNLVTNVHKGSLKKQGNSFQITKAQVGASGLYFVKITSPAFVGVKKVIFN
ncbi:MAG: T9SS type A sorting domain-containing protein [Saprospiraceae bacterium]|nr:T9SS type A sorting domain-containing protein [Saprospiraceae bacterium]